MRYFFSFLLLFLANILFADSPTIESFSPVGLIKGVTQVKAIFSEPMVAFGNPKASLDIFDIQCSTPGKARWIDDRTFVYEFTESLPSGNKCSFELKATVKTLAGKKVSGKTKYSFNTGGPIVSSTSPYTGSYIEEDQIFFLQADGEVKENTLNGKIHFQVEGISSASQAELVPLKNLSETIEILYGKEVPKNLYAVKSSLRFPNGAKVTLVWGKGIQSLSGIALKEDQLLEFTTREAFTANFYCDRENKNKGCIPFMNMHLNFNSSIKVEDAHKIKLKGQDKEYSPDVQENADAVGYVSSIQFKGPFPSKSSFTISIPDALKDDTGRKLSNQKNFPMTVKTDDYPPLIKFSSKFGIVESKGGATLPVTIRNIEPSMKMKLIAMSSSKTDDKNLSGGKLKLKPEDVVAWLRKVQLTFEDKSVFGKGINPQKINIKKPNGSAPFEVLGIPLKDTGFYVMEFESKILGNTLYGQKQTAYVSTSALVTNLAVHLKAGRENSLVWVTSLDKGEPVDGAKVTVRDCSNTIITTGTTNKDGVAILDKTGIHNPKTCSYSTYSSGVFVFAEKDKDFSFVHSSWDKGIESWRFNLPYESYTAPIIAHTILDRSLLRAGETLHLKHVVRAHTGKGLKFADKSSLPQKFIIEHVGSNQKYTFDIQWNDSHTASNVWKIPKEAKLGHYNISFERKKAKSTDIYYSSQFRVEEFRVPMLKGVIKPPSEKLVSPKSFHVDVAVKYLSGGPAGNLAIKFKRFFTNYMFLDFKDYEDYTFANGDLKLGKYKTTYSEEEGEPEEANPVTSTENVQSYTLDANGGKRIEINKVPKKKIPYNVLTELEYRDPNGEIQTISSQIPVYPSEYIVGLKQDTWVDSPDKNKVQAIVLNLEGKPVANAKVKIDLLEKKNYSYRKRLVGGFYSYDNYTEVNNLGNFCEEKTDNKGIVVCENKAGKSGNIIFLATVKDPKGNSISAYKELWVSGEEDWWFTNSDSDRADLLPESKSYSTGDVAKLQLRVPFRKSTVLVTVEREGILDYSIQTVEGKKQVISVPIKKNYSPNIAISALALRGRVGEPKPTAMIDLGKPAYKLGYAEVNVDWDPYKLKVNVTTPQTVYNVREKVDVGIQVSPSGKYKLPEKTEIVVAVVDEGLLELKPNLSWKLLETMMVKRGVAVNTATAQMQVVGRRHYGLKAIPQGGGGGNQNTRELFDTLVYWNDTLTLDSEGKAKVSFNLNDSLTKFRIVVIAIGQNQFGTGAASIRSNQDIMLFSGLSPISRQGDNLNLEFTLRNATESKMDLTVAGEVKKGKSKHKALEGQNISLAAGESKVVSWKYLVPEDAEDLQYTITATSDSKKTDSIKVSQKVIPVFKEAVRQATIFQLEENHSMQLEKPENSIANKGGINVIYSNSLVDGMDGVEYYMNNYPYTCLEQQVSKYIVLNQKKQWDDLMSKLPNYMDSDGLLKYFPSVDSGSPILTAYVLAISHEAKMEIPTEHRARIIQALQGFVTGSIVRGSSFTTPDLTIRKLNVLEALSRYGAAKKEMLDSMKFDPNLLPTSAVLDWWNLLNRLGFKPEDKKMKKAEQILKSRLDMQGTIMRFSSEKNDSLYWLMVSSDLNSVKLLHTIMDMGIWKKDVPRIVRGSIARQKRGSWDITTANAWGILAIKKFSSKFEKTPVSGITDITVSAEKKYFHWKEKPKGGEVFSPWEQLKDSKLSMSHKGEGKPWVTVQSIAAVPIKEAVNSGYSIQKEIVPLEVKNKGSYTKGDVYRIKLKVSSKSDMTWVVLSDPIPAGATILGSGLGRDSSSLTANESNESGTWPIYVERKMELYRAYYDYVPSGEFTVEYTVRLNQDGVFNLPQTRVEAMYSPEMFGEYPNATMKISGE